MQNMTRHLAETLIHTFDVVRRLNPADPWRPPAAPPWQAAKTGS